MLAYIEILRPVNCIMAAIAVYIASVVAGLPLYPSLPVILGMISVFTITAGGMAINDYFDVEIDKVNRPSRPIPSGRISSQRALVYSVILFIIGIVLSYSVNTYALYVAVFSALLLAVYSWKLKKMLLIGHLSVSLLTALSLIYGSLINMNYSEVLVLALLAFLSNTGREIFKTIEDVLGDDKAGVNSLPLRYGAVKAKMIASLFIIAAVMISFVPFFLGMFGFVYLFFVVGADLLFISAILAPTKFSPKMCKIAMNVALAAFLAGAVA